MDIMYITVVGRKIEIHNTSAIYSGSLTTQLERILADFGYIKIDQSTFANMKNAASFDHFQSVLHFKDGKIAPVSRRNKTKVRAYFDNLRQK